LEDELDNNKRAEELYLESLEIKISLYGEDHLETAYA
jgi:hypothetical protein